MRVVSQEDGLKLNYYALYLAIKKRLPATQACLAMGLHIESKSSKRHKGNNVKYHLSDEEYKEIIKLKEKKTWDELGEKYNIPPKSLFIKVKRYMGDDWKNRNW